VELGLQKDIIALERNPAAPFRDPKPFNFLCIRFGVCSIAQPVKRYHLLTDRSRAVKCCDLL